jgi:hypothetical protein
LVNSADIEANVETLPDSAGQLLRDRMVAEIVAEIRSLAAGE